MGYIEDLLNNVVAMEACGKKKKTACEGYDCDEDTEGCGNEFEDDDEDSVDSVLDDMSDEDLFGDDEEDEDDDFEDED